MHSHQFMANFLSSNEVRTKDIQKEEKIRYLSHCGECIMNLEISLSLITVQGKNIDDKTDRNKTVCVAVA